MLFSKQLLPTGAAQVFYYMERALWAHCCFCFTPRHLPPPAFSWRRGVFVPVQGLAPTLEYSRHKSQPLGPNGRIQTVAIACSTGLGEAPSWHRDIFLTAGAHPLTSVKPWCRSACTKFLKPPKQMAHEIWTHTTTNIGLTCPCLKRQRNQLSYSFSGCNSSWYQGKQRWKYFSKALSKTFASTSWMTEHVHTLCDAGSRRRISHFRMSQESNTFQRRGSWCFLLLPACFHSAPVNGKH